MIVKNPTFQQLMQLAKFRELRGVARGEDVVLADADIHMHDDMARLLPPPPADLTMSIFGPYALGEAFVIHKGFGNNVTIEEAHYSNEGIFPFTPKVQQIIDDLIQLMLEGVEQFEQPPQLI